MAVCAWRMYQEAVQGMVEHPVLGTGVGSWLPHWNSVWMGMDVPVTPETQAPVLDHQQSPQ